MNRENQTERGGQESSDEERTRGRKNERQYAPTGSEPVLREPRTVRCRVKISEMEEAETEDRETSCWEVENEGMKTTEGEVNGRSTNDVSTTTTMISNEEDNEKPREEMNQQAMNTEENWHASETTSTQLRMTDFETTRQLE